jgi:hypothetical protein
MPLTTEELIQTIENNHSTAMFSFRGHITENVILNSSGQLARFRQAFDKYPPVYHDKFGYMNLYKLLTKRKITFIVDESYAASLIKGIEPPKCTDLFMTAIDGIHKYTFFDEF